MPIPTNDYLALEQELIETFESIYNLRLSMGKDPEDSQVSEMARLMANAHARLIPRMEKLRAQFPGLDARSIPQMKLTPGMEKAAEYFANLD